MSDLDVTKLKLPELRAELGKRGLNTFGTRQILIDRLNEAIGSVLKPFDKPDVAEADEPPCITSPLATRNNSDSTREMNQFSVKTENGTDASQSHEQDHKRRRSPSRSPGPMSRSDSRDRDSLRSPRRRSPPSRSRMCDEPVGWENSASVFLDSYNCDLSLMVDTDGYSAKPKTEGGFSMMWSGVRANYGLISGKAFFEVRNVRHIPVENLDTMSGGAAHVMRVGWSTENTEFRLGEESQSYGYGGTAKKSNNNKFADYGCQFGEEDVVGAFIEWTNIDAILRFSVNGVDQGECYRVKRSSLGERYALFPHVYVKNVEFALNFGQDGQSPWFPPNVPGDDSMSWQMMNNISISSRVHGSMPPASKAECEIIMMVGLPGAGKTYYAERFREEHREKQFNVLGTNLILDKMKVLNLARQRNYHGRWDVLIDKATKCLNTLINIACLRRRNYVLDQTNVYPSAQRRKMRPFEGFKRKAIVIVPTDEEFRRRIAQREKEEGKEVPESAVLEMKANFEIPTPLSEDPNSVFDEVIFIELGSNEARDLVRTYNQEGQANRQPPEKRQRYDRNRDRSDSRERFRGGGGGGYDRDRGRDSGRGRRDDYRRSPRHDRSREYRGGYNAQRDRSHEDDRYDRGRDRDYGRSQGDRYGGGPAGRFGGPPVRGGYPPSMGPGGGYGGGPRGGMMRGRGGSMGNDMSRGYGGHDDYPGPPPNGRPPRGGRGGYRGGPGDRGPPGGYGAPMDPMYAPPSRFDAPPGSEPPESGSFRGGYGPPGRGGYGSPQDFRGVGGPPPARGGGFGGAQPGRDDSMGGRDGYGGPPSRGGRGEGSSARDGDTIGDGSGAPRGRGSIGGREGYPPSSRGAYQSGQDSGNAPYSYAAGKSAGGPTMPIGAEYDTRKRGGLSADRSDSYDGTNQGPKPSPTYPGPGSQSYGSGYQRGPPSGYPDSNPVGYPGASSTGYPGASSTGYPGASSTGYPGASSTGYPGASSTGYTGASSTGYPGASSTGYTGSSSTGYPGASSTGYPGASSTGYPGSNTATNRPPSSVPSQRPADGSNAADQSRPPMETGSLYSSGATRFNENRADASQPAAPKQSRFDGKPSPTQQPYATYPPNNYQGSYGSTAARATPAPTSGSTASAAPRTGRSRFDVGPGKDQPPSGVQSATPNAPPSQPQTQPTQQAYGYGYASQPPKPDAAGTQSTATTQSPYGAYGYGYGSYGSTYSAPPPPAPAQPRQPATAPASAPTQQSLYASAVGGGGKTQTSTLQTTPTTQTATATDQSAALAAAYASYYGYAAPNSSAIASQQQPAAPASQVNPWQQSTAAVAGTASVTTAASTPTQQSAAATAAAYANYYAAYGYGYPSAATTQSTAAVAPPAGAAPTTQQTMPPYYGATGYR